MKAIDRLYKYIEFKGFKPTRFEKDLGMSNGYLGTQLKRNADLGESILNKIINYCLDMNPNWLLTGKGKMLKGDYPELMTPEEMDLHDKEVAEGKWETIEEKSAEGITPIPLVSQSVAAGFGSADFSIGKSDVKEHYIIPKFRDCKIDFMIEVAGSSMYPKYNSGDVIACSIIRESRFIQWNKVHVIATQEQGLLVKRIKENDSDSILAISDNRDYPPFAIPKSDIKGIALVVGVIRLE
jgi:phage repressor protein C with HTH and peptisase S24 domain